MAKTFYIGLCALFCILPACWKHEDSKALLELLNPAALYKIVSKQSYNSKNQDNCIELTTLDIESGFIHASFGNQVEKTLQKFFKGAKNILLLELDPQALQAYGLEVCTEQNKPDGDFFPHIYGTQKIPAQAVISVIKVVEKNDGCWERTNDL